MKKVRGFIDPISLGFLLSAAVAAGGVTTDKHHQKKLEKVEKAPTEMIQHNSSKKDNKAVKQTQEIVFPLE